jgi:4-carboxymuconolactone decarboxylase
VARLSYVDPATASPEVGAALRAAPLNVFRMTAHASSALKPFLHYSGTLLAKLELDPALRELAILRLSTLTGCDYERVHHEPVAAAVGAGAGEIATAVNPEASEEGTQGRVFDLVGQVVRDGRGSAAATDALRAELGERGLVELLLVVGHYYGLAVLLNTVEIDVDQPLGTALIPSSARSDAQPG